MSEAHATVMIVDDDRDARELYSHVLEDEGIDTVTASSGGEALEILDRDDDVDLVLLDLAMPHLDGLSTAQEIRRNEKCHPDRKHVKLAFLTGIDPQPVDTRMAQELSAETPFLLKDGNVYKTLSQVKTWLRKII
jgi:CheY-like chemotaxis protein